MKRTDLAMEYFPDLQPSAAVREVRAGRPHPQRLRMADDDYLQWLL